MEIRGTACDGLDGGCWSISPVMSFLCGVFPGADCMPPVARDTTVDLPVRLLLPRVMMNTLLGRKGTGYSDALSPNELHELKATADKAKESTVRQSPKNDGATTMGRGDIP